MADNKFLDVYKNYKSIDNDNIDEDEVLNIILDGAENYLKQQYNLYLEKETSTIILNGIGLNYIILPSKYITLSDVKIDSASIDLSNFYIVDNLLYYIDNVFTTGIQNIEVTLDIGFEDIEDIPPSLLTAFFILADKFYEDISKNTNTIDYTADPNFGRIKTLNTLPSSFNVLLQPHLAFVIG